MKDAYEVLHQKQMDLARVRKEIDSLNLAARLLSDDDTSDNPAEASPSSLSDTISQLSDSAAKNVDSLFSTVGTSRSGLWGSRKRAR
jgi:hypothetical protein